MLIGFRKPQQQKLGTARRERVPSALLRDAQWAVREEEVEAALAGHAPLPPKAKALAKPPNVPAVFTFAEATTSREDCGACHGKHRAHTCGKLTRKIHKLGAHANDSGTPVSGAARASAGAKAYDRPASSFVVVARASPGGSLTARLACPGNQGAAHRASSPATVLSVYRPATNHPSPLSSPTGSSGGAPNRRPSADAFFSFAALSEAELRQALPANYGDSIDEIRLVRARLAWFATPRPPWS